MHNTKYLKSAVRVDLLSAIGSCIDGTLSRFPEETEKRSGKSCRSCLKKSIIRQDVQDARSRKSRGSRNAETSELVSSVSDPHACRCFALAASFRGPSANTLKEEPFPDRINRINKMFGIYGLRMNRDNPVDPVQMHSLSCAESQALPESKGAALGQWQHGQREAASLLVGFSVTGLPC